MISSSIGPNQIDHAQPEDCAWGAAGAPERAIMSQTGHRSADMVRKYIREGNLFHKTPAAMVGQ